MAYYPSVNIDNIYDVIDNFDKFFIGYFRSGKAKLVRYWINFPEAGNDNCALAAEMLEQYGRELPSISGRIFVFDNPNHELLFKISWSEYIVYVDRNEFYHRYQTYHDQEYFDVIFSYDEIAFDAPNSHELFFIPSKIKKYYPINSD